MEKFNNQKILWIMVITFLFIAIKVILALIFPAPHPIIGFYLLERKYSENVVV
jgi:hypothetical protein